MSGSAKAIKFFTVPKATAPVEAFSADDFLAELRELEEDVELPQDKVVELKELAARNAVVAERVYEIASESEADVIGAETSELQPVKRDYLEQVKDMNSAAEEKKQQEMNEYLKDKTLCGMIFRNEVDSLEHNLRSGFDPNSLDHRGEHTVLHHAAFQSNIRAVASLLKFKAKPNIRNSRDETPLMWAVKKDDIDIIRLLVQHGADINAVDNIGLTAFMHAADAGKETNMAYLVHGLGIDINSRDHKGKTGLHWAAYRGHASAVKWLLHHGCNRMTPDDVNNLALHWAITRGNLEIVELLFSYQPGVHVASSESCYLPVYDTPAYRTVASMVQEQCAHRNNDARTPWQTVNFRIANPEPNDALVNLYANEIRRYMIGEFMMAYFNMYTLYIVPSLLNVIDYLGGCFGIIFLSCVTLSIFSMNMYLYMFLGPYLWLQYVYYLLVAVSVTAWARVAYTDPGHIRPNAPSDELNPEGSRTFEELYKLALINTREENEAMFETPTPNVCTTCRILRPLRSKHCSSCNRCVHKFDHHCPFLSTDIGANNYSAFFYYCMGNSLGIGLFLTLYITAMVRGGFNWNQLFGEMKCITLSHMCFILCWMLATALFIQHIPFAKDNISTNESINKRKYTYLSKDNKFFNPFASTSLTNCVNVLACLPPETMVMVPSKIHVAKASLETNLQALFHKHVSTQQKEWKKIKTFYDTDDEVV